MPTIEHVVVVVKENHTFDNYFGAFPGAQGAKLPAAADPHPGAPALQPGDPSGDLWECFDFQAPPRLTVPGFVPA